jgi:hypothetical protein
MSFKEVQLSYERHNISELARDYRTIEGLGNRKYFFKNVE